MHPALIALAFAASTLPALLAWLPGGELLGASLLGLALTAWIALAGVPSTVPLERRIWTCVSFALPPLALAAALDLRGGARLEHISITLLEGLAVLAALVIVARRANGAAGKLTLHEGAWLLLVIVPVCARFALDFGLGADVAPFPIAQLARWSPLGWALELCTPSSGLHEHPWRPAIVLGILGVLSLRELRESEVKE